MTGPTRAEVEGFGDDDGVAVGHEVVGAGHIALGAWLWLASSGELPAGRSGFVQ